MPRSIAETTEWLATTLAKHDEVTSAKASSPQVIEITRLKYPDVYVGVVARAVVSEDDVQAVLGLGIRLSFLVNVPKEAIWEGAAIELAEASGVAWGQVRDLLSALGHEHVDQHRNRDMAFVERILKQHSNVRDLVRLFDRKFLIRRKKHADVTVVVLNEYDLTADAVRTARERYGEFTDVLNSNPNGRDTVGATEVIRSIEVKIHRLADFLSRLRKP